MPEKNTGTTTFLLLAAALIFFALAAITGCSGGGGGGVAGYLLDPNDPSGSGTAGTTARNIELEGTLPADMQSPGILLSPSSEAVSRSADLKGGKFVMMIVTRENPTVEAGTVLIGGTGFVTVVPAGSSSKYLMIVIKEKTGGRVIYSNLVGKAPASKDLPAELKTVRVKGVRLDAETTARTLLSIEKGVLPDIPIVTVTEKSASVVRDYTGMKTPFEAATEARLGGTADLLEIKKAVTAVNSIILSPAVGSGVKETIFAAGGERTLSSTLNSFIVLLKADDSMVKALIDGEKLATSVKIGTTTIDSKTASGTVTSAVTGIKLPTADTVKPTITAVSIYPATVAAGDTVTVSLTASEALYQSPAVSIMGRDATVTKGQNNSYTAAMKITSADAGTVTFLIYNYFDLAGNAGEQAYTTTDRSQTKVSEPEKPTVAAPLFDPGPSTYDATQSVKLTCPTEGATIRFTIDGTNPSASSGFDYTAPVQVGVTTTIKAYGKKSGLNDSTISEGTFAIIPRVERAQTPVFSVPAGTYSSTVSVILFTPTQGAAIRYTIDGSTPSATAGTLYSAPITIGATTTVKAVATKTGMENSDVVSTTYTISVPVKVSDPSFTPVPGTYDATQSVTITCATAGATIRYTLDGTDPSETAGSAYTSPVSIFATSIIKAIGVKSGMPSSNVKTGAYVINIPLQAAGPIFVPAAGSFSSTQSVTLVSQTAGAAIRYTLDGSDPTNGSEYTSPITLVATTTIRAIAIKSGMQNSPITSATYTITIPPVPGDSLAPTFTMQYYSDAALTSPLSNNPKLKAGTYYIEVTANEALQATPSITINAEGTANDVSSAAMTLVSGNIYKYARVVASDAAAVGGTIESILVTGRDLNGNAATSVAPTNAATKAAYTDTTVPTITGVIRDSDTQITVTFSENMAASGVTKANDAGFTVERTGTPATTYAVTSVAPGTTANKAVLTVASMTASGGIGVTVKYAASGNGTAADGAGNILATNSTGFAVSSWLLSYVVSATSLHAAGDTVAVVFNRPMNNTGNPLTNKANWNVHYDSDAAAGGETLIPITNADLSYNATTNTLIFTLDETTDIAIIPDAKYIKVTAVTPANIKDTAENQVVSGGIYTAAAIAKETGAPAFTVTAGSVHNGGDTISITFNEQMNNTASAIQTIANWTLQYDDDNAAGGETAITTTNAVFAYSTATKSLNIVLNETTDGAFIPNGKFVKATPAVPANVKDLAGNQAAATGVYSAAGIAKEATAPTFTVAGSSVNNAGDTITLTFSEPMDQASLTQAKVRAGKLDTVKIQYADDNAGLNAVDITVTNATAAWSNKTTFMITLDELTDAAFIPNGKFLYITPVASKIADLVGNFAAATAVASAAIAKEATVPTFTVAGASMNNAGDAITLTFSEPMDQTSLTQAKVRAGKLDTVKIQYADDNAGLNAVDITVTTATAAWSNMTTFVITLDELTDGAFIPNGKFLYVTPVASKIADLVGNFAAATAVASVAIAKESTVPTFTVAGSSIHNAGDTITLTFSEPMDQASLTQAKVRAGKLDTVMLQYANDGAGAGATDLVVTNATAAWSNKTTFVITLDEATDGAFIPNGKFLYITPVASKIADLAGNFAAATAVASVAIAKEATVPTFTVAGASVHNAGDTITLTFSEPMDQTSLTQAKVRAGKLDTVMIQYADDGAGLNAVDMTVTTATASWSNKTTFVITLDELTDGAFIPNGKFLYVTPVASKIADLVGNFAANTAVASAAIAKEATVPTFTVAGSSIHNAGDTITLTFSEPMDQASLTQAKVRAGKLDTVMLQYANDGAGAGATDLVVTNATAAWSNKTTFVITLDEPTDGAFIPNGKFLYITPVASKIADLVGNFAANTAVASVAIPKEATGPKITSVTFTNILTAGSVADGDKIVITFDEVIDPSSVHASLTPGAPQNINTNVTGQVSWSGGGVSPTMTVTNICSFDMIGNLTNARANTSNTNIAIDATKKILTITMTDGITSEVTGAQDGTKDVNSVTTTVTDYPGNIQIDDATIKIANAQNF